MDCHFRVVGKCDLDEKSVISMRNRNVLDSLSIGPVVSQRVAKSIEANRLIAPFTHTFLIVAAHGSPSTESSSSSSLRSSASGIPTSASTRSQNL